jgi:uncharacterized protein (TIGR02266 family)
MVARFDDSKDDRRLEHRVLLEAKVTFERASERYRGVSRDISRGGMFVATQSMVPVGSDVNVDLELESGPLRLQGTVRWTRAGDEDEGIDAGFGIAFTRLEPAQLNALGAVCDEREPYFYEFAG